MCVVIVIVIVVVIRLNAYCEIHSGKGQLQVRERLDSMAISDIVNKESWREINAYQKVKPIQKVTSPKAQTPTHATQPIPALASAPAISLAPVSVPKAVVKEPKKIASKVETDKVNASKVKDEALIKELVDSDEDFLRDTDKSNSDNDNESESESDSDGDSER